MNQITSRIFTQKKQHCCALFRIFLFQSWYPGVYLKNIFDFTSTISITQFKGIGATELNLETAAFIKFS